MFRKPLGGALPGYRRSPLPLHAKPFDLLCRRETGGGNVCCAIRARPQDFLSTPPDSGHASSISTSAHQGSGENCIGVGLCKGIKLDNEQKIDLRAVVSRTVRAVEA